MFEVGQLFLFFVALCFIGKEDTSVFLTICFIEDVIFELPIIIIACLIESQLENLFSLILVIIAGVSGFAACYFQFYVDYMANKEKNMLKDCTCCQCFWWGFGWSIAAIIVVPIALLLLGVFLFFALGPIIQPI